MITTGIFWLNEIVREGADKNDNYWCHILAKEFGTNKGEGHVCLHLFGNTAKFVERNLNESRRAFVTGEMVVSFYQEELTVIKKIRVDGKIIKVPITIVVDKQSTNINVTNIRFLDKASEIIEEEDLGDTEEEVLEAEVLDDDEVADEDMNIVPLKDDELAAADFDKAKNVTAKHSSNVGADLTDAEIRRMRRKERMTKKAKKTRVK